MVSVIIVNYHVEKELLACLQSIKASNPKTSYEIIVVDNNEDESLKKLLKKSFPQIRYIKTEKNIGFGAANNVGATHAKGEYLFFLNPDTLVKKGAIDVLQAFLQKDKKVGMVAPLLLHGNEEPFVLQGTRILGVIEGIVVLSFLNKLWPNNPIFRNYWQTNWDFTSTKKVTVVPGTAFMIKKNIFNQADGFDERFFLYFEEFDLGKRIEELGYQNYIYPHARVVHFWEKSTEKFSEKDIVFAKSRSLYFRKHFGILSAMFISFITQVNKYAIIVFFSVLIGLLLRLYNLPIVMSFIGDQGWFYLSARDMLLTHQIPLVGITASHTWLHQGPLWTYILALIFAVSDFHPLAPGIFTVLFDTATIYFLYWVGKRLYSSSVATIASLLYATSPLIITFAQTPYHVNPIPFFILVFLYALHNFIHEKQAYLALLTFSLAILYNLELATSIFIFLFLFILLYGFWKKSEWIHISKQNILLSLITFLVPMFPIIVYDVSHGFPQTIVFGGWIVYHLVRTVPFIHTSESSATADMQTMFIFLWHAYKQMVYPLSSSISIGILVLTGIAGYITMRYRRKRFRMNAYIVLLFVTIVTLSGFLANRVPSGAYIPMFFPLIVLVISSALAVFLRHEATRWLIIAGILLIAGFNTAVVLFGVDAPTVGYTKRLDAAKQIIKLSEGQPYTLTGRGAGSQFTTYTSNYHYLTWWLGHEPSHNAQTHIFISQDESGIHVRKASSEQP